MNPRLCLLVVLLLACGTLYANICPCRMEPSPRPLPSTPGPAFAIRPLDSSNLKGLKIQMVSEQVDLTLVREDSQSFLDVDVTFMMENHSQVDVTMGVTCPVGERDNVSEFEAETDGAIHDTRLKARTAGRGLRPEAGPTTWSYDWEATFPARQCCIVKVRYRHALSGGKTTGYTVSSGRLWKGNIQKSVITLSGSAEAWSYVRRIGPKGCKESGQRLVWTYHDYEPTTEHDITIRYSSMTLAEDVDALQPQLNHWKQREELCTLLRFAHYSTGKLSNDAAQWRALRQALFVLLREAKADGDTIVMPRNDGEWVPGVRPEDPPRWVNFLAVRRYALDWGAGEVLTWLHEVRLVLDAVPNEPESEALRQAWLAMAIAGSAGRLYAGDKAMESTEEQRTTWAEVAVALNARVP